MEDWPLWEKNKASHEMVGEKIAAVLRGRRRVLLQRELTLAATYRAKYASWQAGLASLDLKLAYDINQQREVSPQLGPPP